MASKREKAVIDAAVSEAEDILIGIEKIRSNKDAAATNSQLTGLLQRLYLAICTLQQYKRNKDPPRNAIIEADKALLEGWKALLKTTEALSAGAPNGHFLAARMMLFLMHGFIYQEGFPYDLQDSPFNRDRVKNQMAFSNAVDEALRSQLSLIWEKSGKKEDFRWALTHLESKDDIIRTDYNQAAMIALSAEELWKVPGMTGQQLWKPKPGDEPIFEPFENATSYEFAEDEWDDLEDETDQHDDDGKENEEDDEDDENESVQDDNVGDVEQPIISQTLSSNGPLEAEMEYCLVKRNAESWLEGPRLKLSRQFVKDATNKA
ncbi:unnamed protein product [Clonostachys rosea f. rosea IK726]|jgi:hypothetical protein|uniref:Uncharacterized protein n=1 Tax=Clonostachys rosea f. rosea IK726 TaxID=1349383 RepID=A0ACA9U3M6_BIOOC|nr:unnamed protein product [Clonostachys rosea f. rosea IK726]